ncbi:tryptophan 2,3-dioxygenase family protein [Phytohabitans rumicis]|uniref:tryptophan 2,3-dioxygenase family protein n=1 Tax=Phytohabitans rumicis TaxID=1076125 RepID=UPI0031EE46B9
MHELYCWSATGRDPVTFPYTDVLRDFHLAGKQFVATDVLTVLHNIRTSLPSDVETSAELRRLRRFLDIALDKFDHRYDYRTYIAVDLLPLPALDQPGPDAAIALRDRDRVVSRLLGDALRFELAAADKTTDMLPRMRPDPQLVTTRTQAGIRALAPILSRLGRTGPLRGHSPASAVRLIWSAIDADLQAGERLDLALTMLPVDLLHDEYLFIRVLQAWEATFALLALDLSAAVTALRIGNAEQAAQRLDAASTVLRESLALNSLIKTMQPSAFHSFRTYTEGASAIQSPRYKLVESLCRRPDEARLDSVAYRSVPDVRKRVLAGHATLDEAYHHYGSALADDANRRITRAMAGFAAASLQWRRAHHRLAVRYLGDQRGTGDTAGPEYLRAVSGIPVFHHLPAPARALRDGRTRRPARSHRPGGRLAANGETT